jgi:hypothetical protein
MNGKLNCKPTNMKKQLLLQAVLGITISLMITGCSQKPIESPGDILQKIYNTPNPFRNEKLDSTLFTSELFQLITQSKETEQKSRETIRMSKAPTDKPLLIEGEIFASLYEGYTGFKVLTTEVVNDTALLSVEFTNQSYQQVWTDKVRLVAVAGSWKLENVMYSKPSSQPDLQQVLRAFIGVGQQEQINSINN